MPHFKFNNITKLQLTKFINQHLQDVINITGCDPHFLNFRVSTDEFIVDDAKILQQPIYVEINWRHRPDSSKQKIVKLLHDFFVVQEKINTLMVTRFSEIAPGDLFDNLNQI